MAGIGFALRKLARRDDFIGVIEGYAHSAIISSGPWLFTILTLSFVNTLSLQFISLNDLIIFRIIIIYNFSFSVVLTGPIIIIATRYVADGIFMKNVQMAPGMLLAVLSMVYGLGFLVAAPFYLFFTTLPLPLALGAVVNFLLVCGIWGVSLFLSALKDYAAVTIAFGVGMAGALIFCLIGAYYFDTPGMIWGFSVGLSIIQFSLVARIFAEYPYPATEMFAFLGYFRRFWDLALIGLFSQMASWADKWVMWGAPERERVAGALITYPSYDSAMFVAYLTILPSLMIFTVNVETKFFEFYQFFFDDIRKNATFRQIRRDHRGLIMALLSSSRNLLILQGAVTIACVMLAPQIINLLGLNFGQIGIFRLGAVGGLFQVLFVFLTVILSYFDMRSRNLCLHLFYFVANGGLTILFSQWGFVWYGYGYFVASLLAFVVAYLVVADALRRLPYLAFIGCNPSIQ